MGDIKGDTRSLDYSSYGCCCSGLLLLLLPLLVLSLVVLLVVLVWLLLLPTITMICFCSADCTSPHPEYVEYLSLISHSQHLYHRTLRMRIN